MDMKFFDTVPIFYFDQSISDLLYDLLQGNITASHIIVCDAKKKPCGIIRMDKLYKKIAFGLQFDHVLESVSDNDYVVFRQDSSFINPDLLAGKTIVVTGEDGTCIGIADNNALLLDYIKSNDAYNQSISDSFLANLDFGFILCDIYGSVINLNPAAKRMLQRAGVSSLGKIDDIIPKFNYSVIRQKYTVQYDDTGLEIKSYPFSDEKEQIKIALLLFDVSELHAGKKALAEVKTRYKGLMEILDNSYDEIYVTDNNSVCVFVNKACERIYGLKCEEMIGKTSAQMKNDGFISSDLSEKVIKTKHRLMDIQTTKIGQKILVVASPIFDKNGEVHRVVINSREIADMIDVRVSVDRLIQENLSQITDKIMELTLKSNKVVVESKSMGKVIKQITRISQTDSNVLILGETGTGKDVIATLIHEISGRRSNRLVRLNCAVLPEKMIEEELFGCEKESAGDRSSIKTGLFALADKSTIFIDEIDEFPFYLQGKLLHAIEDKYYIPSGSSRPVNSNFRLIAATSRNLQELVKKGRFREDLYYRLNVMPVCIPPLRERREDIPFLVRSFLDSINKASGGQKSISPEVIERFLDYQWDGNIRELRNILERLCALSDGNLIGTKDLQLLPEFVQDKTYYAGNYANLIGRQDLPAILDTFEERLLEESMKRCGTTYGLAELLGISQATAVRKMQKYGLKFHNIND